MHVMQAMVINDRGVCLSCGSTRHHCAKMAEQIKMLFGVNTLVGPRNIVLDRNPDPSQISPTVGGNFANSGPTTCRRNG